MTWQTFLTDLKERFIKLDTIHGLIWIPGGIALLFAGWYALQHVILIGTVIAGLFLIVEGLRKLFGNPVKAKAALNTAAAKYTSTTPVAPNASPPAQ